MQAVKDLSIEELKTLIGEAVEEKFREILVDPDAGGSSAITIGFNALGRRAYRSTSSALVSYWEDPAGQYVGDSWPSGYKARIPFGGRTLAMYAGAASEPVYFDHPNGLGAEEQWTNAAGGEAPSGSWEGQWHSGIPRGDAGLFE